MKIKEVIKAMLAVSLCLIIVFNCNTLVTNAKGSYVETNKIFHERTQNEENEIDKLIIESASGNQEVTEILEKEHGVYKMEVVIDNKYNNLIETRSTKLDVEFSTPSKYYDSQADEYVIVGGGHWVTDEWKNEGNLSGADAYYLCLMPDDDSKYKATMNKCVLHVSDDYHWSLDVTNGADNANYKNGIYITFDDTKLFYNANMYGLPDKWINSYSSYHFSVLARYSNAFKDYHGSLAFGYAHTWKDCVIDSFSLSNSGASINFSNQQRGWSKFSPSVRF